MFTPSSRDNRHFIDYNFCRLTAAILPKTKRILNFTDNSKKKQKTERECAAPENWPCRPRRAPQIRSPSMILDMPNLMTDISRRWLEIFFYNILFRLFQHIKPSIGVKGGVWRQFMKTESTSGTRSIPNQTC